MSLAFGIYISWLDYAKGEQFITLITMMIFTFCFLTWRPVYSILMLTVSFAVFYIMCDAVIPATFATKVNLFIIWIAIMMASLSSYHLKIREAKKDENLEQVNEILVKLAISDEVTGISNMNYFRSQALAKIMDRNVDISKMLFLFLDISHFKGYNERYGFIQGNDFLRKVAHFVEDAFPGDLIAHFSNDNYVVFAKDEEILKKLEHIRTAIKNADSGIHMGLKVGAYRPQDRECLPVVACDHARYACYSIKKLFDKNYCEYDSSMNQDFYRKQHVINNIDSAITDGYIKVYYQPVVTAKTGKLCGLEALARWDDPIFGFLTPDSFIKTLEEYHLIHKLDMHILEKVCLDLKEEKSLGHVLLPVSLNFSSLDFDALDLAKEVERCMRRHGIEKNLIHVEITETALVENDGKLQKAMEDFRRAGYALWLDDFGSGYSGLNVLKEYEFDMMKIDMKFLQNFSGNEKARQILRSVINLAKEIGMKTLTEGVETEEARDFLKSTGCEKLQGYLFGKPMPRTELLQKIQDGTYIPEAV
ncbi:MAG: EAL domain-containing protein [Treponema sp.]|nr:EAL domain-containing protein [Treponema sp.]